MNSTEANAFPRQFTSLFNKTGHGGSQVSQWNVGGTYWINFTTYQKQNTITFR